MLNFLKSHALCRKLLIYIKIASTPPYCNVWFNAENTKYDNLVCDINSYKTIFFWKTIQNSFINDKECPISMSKNNQVHLQTKHNLYVTKNN